MHAAFDADPGIPDCPLRLFTNGIARPHSRALRHLVEGSQGRPGSAGASPALNEQSAAPSPFILRGNEAGLDRIHFHVFHGIRKAEGNGLNCIGTIEMG